MASSEAAPLAKTGGLADVVGALPGALRRLGVDVSVILPAFHGTRERGAAQPIGMTLDVPISSGSLAAEVERGSLPDGTPVYLIRRDDLFDRDALYGDRSGDYADNAARFAFFSRAVLELLEQIGAPDVLHAHDWQAGLSIALLRADSARYPRLARTRTALTVHNLGYQGVFWAQDWHLLALDHAFFSPRWFEFWNHINYLKAGLVFADAITTVSRRYAAEICTPELGNGLDGVLRERRHVLRGILNGVDYSEWSPETDRRLPAAYSARDLAGKARCKQALQQEVGLPVAARTPLFCMVSRLAQQKGIDLVADCGDALAGRDLQLVVLGSGDPHYERRMQQLAERHPARIAVHIAFDEDLAHRVQAGSDALLMPSQYEPCGLNQIYALHYGTAPVVRATGGLDDTVEDFNPANASGTGFKFEPYEPAALLRAIDRARGWYAHPKAWATLIGNAMRADFSWDRSAREYVELYASLKGG